MEFWCVTEVVVPAALAVPAAWAATAGRASAWMVGLLVHAEDDGGIRGIECGPDDLAQPIHELRIGRELKASVWWG
jgi:hypothetical protein